jgi:hypothetical protein
VREGDTKPGHFVKCPRFTASRPRSASKRFLREQAGLELGEAVTVARKGDHVFVNFDFVIE